MGQQNPQLCRGQAHNTGISAFPDALPVEDKTTGSLKEER